MERQWPENPPPIVVVGPTAVGKTPAAMLLAERRGAEIVNADSMQVYRGMDIGTAKPTAAEQARVPFHLLDLLRPDESFSVSEWKQRAEEAIAEITRRGKQAIICGGTGMYIRALLDNWTLGETPANPEIRAALQQERAEAGTQALYERLKRVDPVTAARLHPNDGVRIVRALEVSLTTGTPLSAFQERDRANFAPRPAIRLGLTLPRPELYQRIEQRVDAMIAAGWEAEVRRLLQEGYAPTLTPLQSLGYKEMVAYSMGTMDRETAISEIKQNTRRFAKRQMTWFRADTQIVWHDVSQLSSAEVAERLEVALQTPSV